MARGQELSNEPLPRELTAREREILDFLLSADRSELETFRSQAESAVVVGRCGCGCASIDFVSDDRAKEARVVADTWSKDEELGLLLWAHGELLAGIEIHWTGDDIPTALPPAEAFEPPRLTSARL